MCDRVVRDSLCVRELCATEARARAGVCVSKCVCVRGNVVCKRVVCDKVVRGNVVFCVKEPIFASATPHGSDLDVTKCHATLKEWRAGGADASAQQKNKNSTQRCGEF